MKYSKEMISWLNINIDGRSWSEITMLFNAQFGTNQTSDMLEQKCLKEFHRGNGIIGGQFKRGQKPWNKGLKMPDEVKAKILPTLFHKGNKTWNHREVGEERYDKNGYILVKIKEPRTWRRKHFVEWEKYNKPINIKKECLIFLDGDKTNCDISNLKKISRGENATMSKLHLWQKNKELNETALNIVKIVQKVRELKK